MNNMNKRVTYESWSHLHTSPNMKKLDPDDPEAFVDVDMPFMERLIDGEKYQDKIAHDDFRRVDWLHVLIAGHAILHQHQRQMRKREDGRLVLVATEEDFNAVLPIFKKCVMSERSSALGASKEAFLKVAQKLFEESLTVQELETELDKKERTVRSYLKDWRATGLVEEEYSYGKTKFHLGPLMNKMLDTLSPNSALFGNRSERAKYVDQAAKNIFCELKGFQPELLSVKEELVECTCPLHVCT